MGRIAALTRNPVMIALVAMLAHRRLRLEEDPEQCRRPWPQRRRRRDTRTAQDFTVNIGDRIFFDTDSPRPLRRTS